MKGKEMSKNRQMALNLIAGMVVFVTNLLISFFLSPYIVRTIGVEANGFVMLANNFVSYASLVTIALNSMSSRFITLKLHQNDVEGASRYYTSVFVGNIAVVIVMFIPAAMCIYYLENIINIPAKILFDVKILFSFIFLNFFVRTGVPSWSISFFATNKLYLQSACSLVTEIFRIVILLCLFSFFSPNVYYVGISAFVITVITLLWAAYNKGKLMRQVKIRKKYYDFKALIELISSGIWNTVTQLGTMLLQGFDLLITNLLIGSVEMGVLSLAKAMPNIIGSLSLTISNVFNPSLTISYAKNDMETMLRELKSGMKITSSLLTVILAALIAFGYEFFSLWQPTQDARVLQILSVLSCLPYIISNSIQCLYNVFTITNKLKTPAILLVLTGLVNMVTVYFLIKNTAFGIFAVAGVSSIMNIIRHLAYTIPYTAKYLNLKWTTFYPNVFISLIAIAIDVLTGLFIKQFFVINSWFSLIAAGAVYSILCIAINGFVILNKKERRILLNKLLRV